MITQSEVSPHGRDGNASRYLPGALQHTGEAVRADLRGLAGLAGMARLRFVDNGIIAYRAGPQRALVLAAKYLRLGRHQTHHLPFGNQHPLVVERARMRSQATVPGC